MRDERASPDVLDMTRETACRCHANSVSMPVLSGIALNERRCWDLSSGGPWHACQAETFSSPMTSEMMLVEAGLHEHGDGLLGRQAASDAGVGVRGDEPSVRLARGAAADAPLPRNARALGLRDL